MQKITKASDLKIVIQELEYKQALELSLLKEQFLITYDSLRPINIIKNTLRDLTSSPEIKDNLIGTTVGLTAGYISKTIIQATTSNPLIKIFATVLQFGISNVVSKNQDTIKLIPGMLMKLLGKKKEPQI
jgi:hypothetical protein